MEPDYKTVRELGRGAAGIVRLVLRRRDKRKFAAKEIAFADVGATRTGAGAANRDALMREVRVMRDLPHHPSIVGLDEVIDTREGIVVVMEYVDGGSLQDLVYPNGAPGARTAAKLLAHAGGGGGGAPTYSPVEGGNDDAFGSDTWGDGYGAATGNSPTSAEANDAFQANAPAAFPEQQIMTWLLHLGNALRFLHGRGVVHRDIKLQNILLTKESRLVKIADFGVAENLIVNGKEGNARTAVGTPMYMSPEVCDSAPYNTQSDMWSLGVVAYELCCRRPPFAGGNMLALVDAVTNHAVPRIDAVYSDELDAIVRGLLTKDPSRRPTADTLERQLKMKRQGASADEICRYAGLVRETLASEPFISRHGGTSMMADSQQLPGAVPLANRADVNSNHPKPAARRASAEDDAEAARRAREQVYADARRAAAENRRKFESSLLDHQLRVSPRPPVTPTPAAPVAAAAAANDADEEASPSGRHRDANSPVPEAEFDPRSSRQSLPPGATLGGTEVSSTTATSAAAFEEERFKADYAAEIARQQAVLGELFPDTPRDPASARASRRASQLQAAIAATEDSEQHQRVATPPASSRHHHHFDNASPDADARYGGGHDDTLDSVLIATPAPHSRQPPSASPTPKPAKPSAVTETAGGGADAASIPLDRMAPTTSVGGNPAKRVSSASARRGLPSTSATSAAHDGAAAPPEDRPAEGGVTPTIPDIPLPSARIIAHNASQGRPPRGATIACRNCREGGVDAAIASVYCDDCRAALCASCALVIHRHSMFTKHAMAPLDLGGSLHSTTATATTAAGDTTTDARRRRRTQRRGKRSATSTTASSASTSSDDDSSASDNDGAARPAVTTKSTARKQPSGRPVAVRDAACDTASLVARAEAKAKREREAQEQKESGCCVVM